MNIALLLRTILERELTWEELDDNFRNIKSAIDSLETSTGQKVTAQQAKDIALEELNRLVGAAPGQLATLEALAEALGNDPDFAASISAKFGQIDTALATKVASRAGYSLISNTELQRLAGVTNQDLAPYQLKETGKSLISNTELQRLSTVTNQDISGKSNTEAAYSTDRTVYFNEDTVHGKVSAPVSGKVTTINLFDPAKPAKLGVVSLQLHQNTASIVSYTFVTKAGIQDSRVVVLSGEYKFGVLNYIYLQLIELPTATTQGVVAVVYKQIP